MGETLNFPLQFDHLAISARNLAEGVSYVEKQLGVSLDAGGHHPHMGTHNRLLSLGPGAFLEVISIDPDAPSPAQPRWFDLDNFNDLPRLTNWIARADKLKQVVGASPAGIGNIVSLARGGLRWEMAVPENGQLPFDGVYPALISWECEKHPSELLTDKGCRLQSLRISHPDASSLSHALWRQIDLNSVEIVPGPKPKLSAKIVTPTGIRVLE